MRAKLNGYFKEEDIKQIPPKKGIVINIEENLVYSFDLKEISKDTDVEIEVNDYINNESLEKDYDIFK